MQSRAGVSRGALTHHFTTKAELVLAAMDHLYEEFSESVRKAAAALPDDPAARVRLGIELIWERFHGPLFVAAMELWTAARTDAELRAALLPHERRLGRSSCAELAVEVFGERVARHPAVRGGLPGAADLDAGPGDDLRAAAGRAAHVPHLQHWLAMAEAFGRPDAPTGGAW